VIIIGVSRDIEFDLRNDLYAQPDPPLAGVLRAHAHRRHHGPRHNDLNAVRTMLGPGVCTGSRPH